MADRTTGPQKAMRPVSLWASLRDEVRRAAPSTKSLGISVLGRGQIGWLRESFHVFLNETLSLANCALRLPGTTRASLGCPPSNRRFAGTRLAAPARAKQRREACFRYRIC